MSNARLERRVQALETGLARLRRKMEGRQADATPWWERIWGSFAGDPTFKDVVRLGRHYRKTFRPRGRRKAGR